MDGLRGKVGYVVAQRNLAVVRAPTEAPNPFAPSPFEAPFGRNGRGVTFTVSDTKEMEESIMEAPKITKSFVSVDDGYVFRVASVNRAAFPPKATMGDILEDLCDAEDAFDDLLHYTDYSVPQEYGEPICVSQCGDDVFVLFCTEGVIVGDVREVVGGPHATFVDVSGDLQPSGAIRYGVASAPQRFRPIKSDTPMHLIVVQSNIIEVCEMVRTPDGSYSLKAILRTTEDRCTPHRFTPFFHGSADELVIAYQSLKKTELSVFNLTTHTMQSICKLPKPSSLRFYQPTQAKPGSAQQVSELPVSVFAIAAQDGQYLLRYNVSMHVMSVYSWDEILQRSAAKKIPLVNSVFIRDPLKIKDTNQLQIMLGSRGRQQSGAASSTTPQQVASMQLKAFPCAWLCVESETLQKYIAKHTLKVSELDKKDDAHERVADNIHSVVEEHFKKIVRSAGGKYIEYAPPPFTLVVDEEEGNTQAEIDELEAEYLANRPRHEGVWCATFNDALDALRVAMQLLRVLTNEGKWSPEVLALPHCGVVEKAHEPKSQLERRHPEFTADPNACQYISRGPPVRPLVAMGDTVSSPYELLRSHRMVSDVRNNVEMARRNPIPLSPPIETDGVVVMDGALFRTVKPMLDLMGVLPPVSAKVPHAEAPASPTSSPTSRFKAIPVRQLCVVAPAELKYRVEPIIPTLQREPTSPTSKRALLQLHK